MAKQQSDFSALKKYIPDGSFDAVMRYIHAHEVQLTLTRERKSILGDYRAATRNAKHRISINGNLNKYAFLVTLLHELAHLFTFEKYQRGVAPHGKEWKFIFGKTLEEFIRLGVFPHDVELALAKTLKNPGASSCADADLMRTLRKYDVKPANALSVEDLGPGDQFKTADGRIFQLKKQLRKRFACEETATGKMYLFSGLYEVSKVNDV